MQEEEMQEIIRLTTGKVVDPLVETVILQMVVQEMELEGTTTTIILIIRGDRPRPHTAGRAAVHVPRVGPLLGPLVVGPLRPGALLVSFCWGKLLCYDVRFPTQSGRTT